MIRREQIIIDKISPDLPIYVFPLRKILPKLREVFEDDNIDTKTELQIHSMVYMGDEGGIVCEIQKEEIPVEEMKQTMLCSITHFRVKKGESHYLALEKYRIKRTKRLAKQSRRKW